MLDSVLLPFLSSREFEHRCERRIDRAVHRLGRVHRILVLADIHLGDAVMNQTIVTAVRDFFPDAEVDYVVSRAAAGLVAGNTEVTRLYPLYTGGTLPSEVDLAAVSRVCRDGEYDLALNASPFFESGRPVPRRLPLLSVTSHTPHLLRNEMHPAEPNHFLYQAHLYVHRALGRRFQAVRHASVPGVRLTLSDVAWQTATAFREGLGWDPDLPVVLVNPDTASRFTCPPFALLSNLLEELAGDPVRLLVGEGHTDPGVGRRLLRLLPERAASRARVVPSSLPIEAYAALTDLVDVFVSGDTGPLHWAAARKASLSGRFPCRNRTFVVSLFGATPARMSGYDSRRRGFLPAWQDAPSTTFVSEPPCRNITCLNKLYKTCRDMRCFEGLGAHAIASEIRRYLRTPEVQQRRRPAAERLAVFLAPDR